MWSMFSGYREMFWLYQSQNTYTKIEVLRYWHNVSRMVAKLFTWSFTMCTSQQYHIRKKTCYVGVPQGSILGPFLFLLYVNDLPQNVQNQNCNIFADDTIIYSVGSNAEDISSKLQGTLDTIMPWNVSNRLSINANKSAVMLIGKPSQIQDDVDIKINGIRIEQVQSMKYLGIYIDKILSWDVQCDFVLMLQAKYRSCAELDHFVVQIHWNYFLRKQSSLFLIMPVLCGVTQSKATSQSYNVLKTALLELLLATSITLNFRSVESLHELNWASVKERRDYFTAVMMFKAINGLTPAYLTDSIVMASKAHDRNTRLTNSYDVHVPPHNSEILKRSLVYNGSVLWNSLRHEVKLAYNVNTFKRMYKDIILVPSQSCS